MKLTRKQKQLIVLAIGLIFIGFGVVQALFKVNVNRAVADQISFILMVGAAVLLFSKDKEEPAPPKDGDGTGPDGRTEEPEPSNNHE